MTTSSEKRGSVRMMGGIYLHCKDPKSLAKWYEAALGLKLKAVEERAGAFGLQFPYVDAADKSAKSYVFALLPGGAAGAARDCTVSLRVDDLEGVLARLREAGAKPSAVETASWGRLAQAEDPEGHRLELWQASQSPEAVTGDQPPDAR